MSAPAARRAAYLTALAVLAVAVAIAVGHHHKHQNLPAGAGPWTPALAAAWKPTRATACGVTVGATTTGVGVPVLPCGVELYLRFGDRTVLTTVIDRGHVPSGRGLDLTPALAAILRVDGTQRIEWRSTR